MFEEFTVEETNLMSIFDTSSRNKLLESLTIAITDFEDEEIIEIAERVLKKLIHMDDSEFDRLDFYPIYEDYDEQED